MYIFKGRGSCHKCSGFCVFKLDYIFVLSELQVRFIIAVKFRNTYQHFNLETKKH